MKVTEFKRLAERATPGTITKERLYQAWQRAEAKFVNKLATPATKSEKMALLSTDLSEPRL